MAKLLVYQNTYKRSVPVQYTRVCINAWMSCRPNYAGATPLKLENLPAAEKELRISHDSLSG